MNEVKQKARGLVMAAICAVLIAAAGAGILAAAQQAGKAPAREQYLIVIRPNRPTFLQDATPEEQKTGMAHFEYLKRLMGEGKVVYAGRREDAVFGLIVLEVSSREEAMRLAQEDPAIKSRMFAWEIHAFHTALIRGAKP